MPKRISEKKIEAGLEALIAFCTDNQEPPGDFVVEQFLGVGPETLDAWRSAAVPGPGETPAAARKTLRRQKLVRRLDAFRTQFWQRVPFVNPRLQSFAVFHLKQPAYGGFSDKGGAPVRAELHTDGIGGDEALE